MRKVAVIGFGQTKFGEIWDKSIRDLASEASLKAILDSKIDRSQIDGMYVGSMSSGRFAGQEHLSALVVDNIGLNPIPSTRTEAACSSGATAFREAYLAIASGHHDVVIATGVEKMTDVKISEATTSLAAASDQEWESGIGVTFPGLYGLMARAHMNKHGTTSEQLATVAVINHKNGSKNPYAQYPFEVTHEKVLSSPMIADPLRLLDCSPITDGSASIILASEEVAKKLDPVWVLSVKQGSDSMALHDRKSLTELYSAKIAAKKAFEEAGITKNNIDVTEVHDCFTINELLGIEALGYCEEGESGKFVENEKISYDGETPVNTSGGLKSGGHPVGATGIRQIGDLYLQLKNKAYNQVNGAKTGLALNVGGSGATANVTILRRD